MFMLSYVMLEGLGRFKNATKDSACQYKVSRCGRGFLILSWSWPDVHLWVSTYIIMWQHCRITLITHVHFSKSCQQCRCQRRHPDEPSALPRGKTSGALGWRFKGRTQEIPPRHPSHPLLILAFFIWCHYVTLNNTYGIYVDHNNFQLFQRVVHTNFILVYSSQTCHDVH